MTGLTYNSKLVEKGYAFVCMKGFHTDGHIYAMDAAFQGASVIISEEDIDIKAVPVLRVIDSRRVLSKMAANFYENKSVPFRLYGVTGTNGKTTVAYMLKSIIRGRRQSVRYDRDHRIPCREQGVRGAEYDAPNPVICSTCLPR